MNTAKFRTFAKGNTPTEAFNNAKRYVECMGFSNAVDKKKSIKAITIPNDVNLDKKSIIKHTNDLLNNEDSRISSPTGSAGYISLGNNEYVFFGFVSKN